MTHRTIGRIVAAVGVAVSLASGAVAGQEGRWSPPRLPDGQPDMQGHWISDAVGAAHSVEDGRDPDADIIQGRVGEQNPVVIVAPPDNRIPYTPAMAMSPAGCSFSRWLEPCSFSTSRTMPGATFHSMDARTPRST